MLYRLALAVTVAGCATAASEQSSELVDAAQPDVRQVDAAAMPCMATMTTQLLANPSFDTTPAGTGWTATPINPTYPIVTTDDGITEQSPSMKAWMGGIAQANANDQLYQDIVIPPNTAGLVIKGFYAVGTTEAATAGIKDTATLQLTDTTGAMLDAVLAVDNKQPTTAWTAVDRTVPNAAQLSGKTVRVILKTSNDASAHTNFFFDSLTVTATHCP